MSPEDLNALAEAVAERVVERLGAEPAPPSQPAGLVDAATLARALAVSKSWVYSNSRKLGAVRLGNGPKPRLRFHVGEAVKAHESERPAPATPRAAKGRPRRPPSSLELLPIRRAARATPTGLKENHDGG